MSAHAVIQLATLFVLLRNSGDVAASPYVLGYDYRPAATIFRIKAQQTLTETQNNEGLLSAQNTAILQGGNPNQAIAIYLESILDDRFVAKVQEHTGVRIIFALFVADAQVVANFRRRQEVWITPGNTGEIFSNGLAQWPSAGQSCRSSAIQGRVSPRDYPFGRPCNEGGAVALKREDWGGIIKKPKNVMAFYMRHLHLEAVSMMSQLTLSPHNDALRRQVTRCLDWSYFEIPVNVTKLAMCARDPPFAVHGAFAAAVAAQAIGQNIAGNPDEDVPAAVQEDDDNLSGSAIPDGSMFIETRIVRVFGRGQEALGHMKLLFVILPFFDI